MKSKKIANTLHRVISTTSGTQIWKTSSALIEKVHILKRITNSVRLFNPLQLTNEVVKQHIKHVVLSC
jgi:hypothetical protein